MAAGIGGVLVLGAGITLLLALLRLSDGSLLLANAVARPPRLKLLGGDSDQAPPEHHLQQHQYRQQRRLEPRLSDDEDEDAAEAEIAAAERWLLYETGGNGIVDLEGIPPPQPHHAPPGHHQHRQHPPPMHHPPLQQPGTSFVLPPPWNKRDQHPLRPASEPPGDSHPTGGGPPELPKGLANQFMLRSPRGNRQYDVPQIGEFFK
ncbi:hypothetical protein L9F63_015642 [Diploptera punctata]|uniref:Uncharacterized protein n=1 Tax=Diploptera punctata TaxID=6984 RepID=A0AAD8A5G8_DIPPU|nr:hypothetical protein L9F63_015642 [Diploptera punctata]